MYHSNSIISALSSSWTSKPPLAIKYQLDTGILDDSGGGRSHGSTLERLLAWEKKLYEEVKVFSYYVPNKRYFPIIFLFSAENDNKLIILLVLFLLPFHILTTLSFGLYYGGATVPAYALFVTARVGFSRLRGNRTGIFIHIGMLKMPSH